MNATVEDLRFTIIPKSDQLNAEQLLGGPMTITVTEVRVGSGEDQPVIVHYHGEAGRPYKPCKTMRKVLIHAWGADGREWSGKSMTLYNDPSVRFGGEDVGGIRISHLSDIESDIKVSLTSTRGKKAKYQIKKLASKIAGQLSEIAQAAEVGALKDTFAAAYKSTKDAAERAQLKGAYDKRMAQLQIPPIADLAGPTTRTLERFKQDIEQASDVSVAQLILDDARSVLTAEEKAALDEHYRANWEQ